MRTPLGRVRGLGSAHSGTGHFWHQRLTAVANVPLTIAFVMILVSLLGRSHAAVVQILGSPLVAIVMLLFVGSITYHMKLGMQVIIEDYVHDEKWKFARDDREHLLRHRGRARLRLRAAEAVVRSLMQWRPTANERQRRRAGGERPRLSDRGSHLRRRGGRRRRRGPARGRRLRRSRPAHRLHHQGVPDPLAHRRGAGRHRGLARQHGRGRLALAHVRHRQGRRLARRPGRDRIPVPQRAGRRVRARALGPAVLAPRGRRQDLSAPVRRHDHALRQGHRAAHLRGRRPHRPRHAAHDVRPGAAAHVASSSSSISPST